MPKINNTTTPDGYEIAGPADVIGTQEQVQKLWQRFEALFPKQDRNEPCESKKGRIWYTTNGKSRRTRIIKLFEKMTMEFGALAGDVRHAFAVGEPRSPKAKKGKGKAKAIKIDKPKKNPNRYEVREPGMSQYWSGKTIGEARKALKQAHSNGLNKAKILKDGEWLS